MEKFVDLGVNALLGVEVLGHCSIVTPLTREVVHYLAE